MKVARNVLQIILLLLAGAALMFVVKAGSGLNLLPSDRISSADFISIILTALGVILAALALFIGVLAIVGWATFEERLKHHSEEFLRRRFSPEDQRYVDLVNELKEDVRRELELKNPKPDEVENESPFDPDAI
jgi:hypothetical protein